MPLRRASPVSAQPCPARSRVMLTFLIALLDALVAYLVIWEVRQSRRRR